MKMLTISISEEDFEKYGLKAEQQSFEELEELIQKQAVRNALYACQEIAEREGLSKMSMEEIDQEVKAVRN